MAASTPSVRTTAETDAALTWMDARVDGVPVTQRSGKAVEINALWIEALTVIATLRGRTGKDSSNQLRRSELSYTYGVHGAE